MTTPRRRPVWWPQDEDWPPSDWTWRHRRRGRYRGGPPLLFRFGCAVFFFVLFVVVALSALVWVVGVLVRGVSSPAGGSGFLVVLFVVALLAAGVAFRRVRRVSVPLDDLAEAAERIERGDYSTRVAVTGPPQMQSLARAFNEMSERLAATDERRRAFLADAAHELRTPLSIISGQLEAIEDGVYPADAAHLAPVHEQLRLLEKLIDDMRTVALAESGALTLKLEPTDVGASIDHTIAAFQTEAIAAGVTLTADYPPGLPRATADQLRLGQVLTNLMSNAIRHTPNGGHVTVSAVGGQEIEVSVRDDGAGVDPELLPRVFDRFAKAPGSTGSGLGLAICRDLVEAMGGQIKIESEVRRGTTLKFTLPLAL